MAIPSLIQFFWTEPSGSQHNYFFTIYTTFPQQTLIFQPIDMISIKNYINTPSPISIELGILFHRDHKMVIFDIGACEGEDSIRYAKMYRHATIFSFEPLPKNFKKVQENIQKYSMGNIFSFCLALGDTEGETKFYVSTGSPEGADEFSDWDYGNKSSSLLPPNQVTTHYAWLKFDETITVKTTTLAQFCGEHHIDKIDLLHMDVQGAELMVLNGAETYLEKTKAVWLEVEAVSLYKDQPLKNDVQVFMAHHGFIKVVDKTDSLSGDQLYVNKRFFKENWIRWHFYPQRMIKKTNLFFARYWKNIQKFHAQ